MHDDLVMRSRGGYGGATIVGMRKHLVAVAVLFLAACGNTRLDGDDVAPDSGGGPDNGDGPGPDGGGALDAGGTNVNVNCVDYDTVWTYSDGSVITMRTSLAMVASIHVGDRFRVARCGLHSVSVPVPATCPAGFTCTSEPLPSGETCTINEDNGSFVGGDLQVSCGSFYENRAAAGGVINSNHVFYDSITVTKL